MQRGTWLDERCRQLVFNLLADLKSGSLTITEGSSRRHFGRSPSPERTATLSVLHPRFFRDIVTGGSLGAARAYLDGCWECNDLTALFRIFVANASLTDRLEDRWLSKLTTWPAKIFHAVRDNSPAGSRKNIQEHYDLGNDLFELFLDPTMTYSAGIFEHSDSTMEEASIEKLDRICRKLQLSPEDHVLEIGTGWGSFAIHAARTYGSLVTTTTISEEQHRWAANRIREAGLEERITLLRSDYRELEGRFDKLVSIEMIEAVGHKHLPGFFRVCSERLKPHGQMLLQAITFPDQRYARYLRSVDFVQKYIFPGSCLTSIADMTKVLASETDFKIVQLEDIGLHYARTLRCWRRQFNERLDEVSRLGYDRRFIRLWNLYLSYCEAGFAECYLGDVQMLLHRTGCRKPAPLGTLD